MYRKQVRRRRAVLALLVVGSFVLLTITYGRGSNGLQRGVSADLQPGPVGRRPGAEAGPRPRQLVRRDLRRARPQQPPAQPNWRRSREAGGRRRRRRWPKTHSCASCSSSTAAERSLPATTPVTGRVIARSPTVWFSDVTIDVGSGDGVARQRPGRQRRRPGRHRLRGDRRLGPGDADRRPLQRRLGQGRAARGPGRDPARSRRPRRPDPRLHRLDQARPQAARRWSPPAGARQGIESRFPPNIPIGEVTEASIVEQEAQQQVHVRPFADLRDLDLVQVLTGGSRG